MLRLPLAERRKMAQWWADHLDLIRGGEATKVIAFANAGKLREAYQRVGKVKSSDTTGYAARFAHFFFDPDFGLDRKFSNYLAEAKGLTDALRAKRPLSPSGLAFVAREGLADLTTSIDAVRSQSSLLSADMLRRLREIQLAAYGFILVLFVAMGFYIIFPTKRLLEVQQRRHRHDQRSQQQEVISSRAEFHSA